MLIMHASRSLTEPQHQIEIGMMAPTKRVQRLTTRAIFGEAAKAENNHQWSDKLGLFNGAFITFQYHYFDGEL